MPRWLSIGLFCVLALVGSAWETKGDDVVPPGIASHAWAITDAVLTHDLEPPSRQQMLLQGFRKVFEQAGSPPPIRLAESVSQIQSREHLDALLAWTWPQPTRPEFKTAFLQGLLSAVTGEPELKTVKDAKVEESMQANLYVGIHIALGYELKTKTCTIQTALDGGPAQRAGLQAGDRIETIDGVSAVGSSISEVVNRLRGELGTDVTLQVRRDNRAEPIQVRLTRSLLPHKTVEPVHPVSEASRSVGVITIKEILGGTPRELRELARQVQADGYKGLILDLRSTNVGSLHSTVLLADALLDGGIIGKVQTVESIVTYQAEPDALFLDLPMAVLVGPKTGGMAAWLAASLQANGRAQLFGTLTPVDPDVHSMITVPEADWVIQMTTGRLLLANGRPLNPPRPEETAGPLEPNYQPINRFRIPGSVEQKSLSQAVAYLEQAIARAARPSTEEKSR